MVTCRTAFRLAHRCRRFAARTVRGGFRTLEDYRGKRVMLVHLRPGCGFCDAIAADLAEAVPELRKCNTELALVTSGDAETSVELARKYGFDCPVVLEDESHQVDGFRGVAGPRRQVQRGRGCREQR
jgi:peroxiredoxin